MDYATVMNALEGLGTERTKRTYMSQGAREPLFGIAIKDLNPIAKKIKINQPLAEELYASGNYDAMYLAGMIANVKNMTEADYDRWMDQAYFYMLSDYTVAIMLADSPLAFRLADKWIASNEDLRMSAGWSTYTWMLGVKKDGEFDAERLRHLLHLVRDTIHQSPNRTRYAMNSFLMAVGVSFVPLHEEAAEVANMVGEVTVSKGKGTGSVAVASEAIAKAATQGRLGFKRKALRC